MGSFSWLRATKTTKRKNIVEGDKYKILIPEEFGGGFIIDTYFGYGYVFEYDDTKPNADLYGMIQTINLNKKAGSKRKIIAIANLELDTLQDEETIKESYENVLDDSLKTAQKKNEAGLQPLTF